MSARVKTAARPLYRAEDGEFLFVRTCDRGMRAHGGFVWPRSGKVECPDWSRNGACGNGLHGLLWGWGNPELASWTDDAVWLVCRADDLDDLDGKIKVPRAEVLYAGSQAGAAALLWDAGVRGVTVPGSRVMSQFCWSWWTSLDESSRSRLLLTLPQDIGRVTVSPAAESARVLMICDWQVRVMTPAWLDAAKLHAEATALRDARTIMAWSDLDACASLLRGKSAVAMAAARAAAWAAAMAAAWAAAGDAAWAAAGAAAWAAAGDAAWAAVRAAAWAAAGDAAWAAVRAAAGDGLSPTVAMLQSSARDLLVRMAGVEAGR